MKTDLAASILNGVILNPKGNEIVPGMWVQLANGWIVGPVMDLPEFTSIYVSGGKRDGRESPWMVIASDDPEFEGREIGIREIILCGWPN